MQLKVNQQIKVLRTQKLGLSRKEFIAPLGISEGVLYLIEKGKTKNVTLDLLEKIVKEYNCDWDWLTKGGGDMFLSHTTGHSDIKTTLIYAQPGFERLLHERKELMHYN